MKVKADVTEAIKGRDEGQVLLDKFLLLGIVASGYSFEPCNKSLLALHLKEAGSEGKADIEQMIVQIPTSEADTLTTSKASCEE